MWWRLEGPKEDHRLRSGSGRAPITRLGEANGGHWWQEEKVLWCKFKVLGVWYWASESGVRSWWVYSFPFQQPPTLQKASVKLRYVPCSLFSSLQLFLFHFAFGTYNHLASQSLVYFFLIFNIIFRRYQSFALKALLYLFSKQVTYTNSLMCVCHRACLACSLSAMCD